MRLHVPKRVAVLSVVAAPAAAFDAIFSGSAAVDYRLVSGNTALQNPSPLGINGLTFEVAQKIVAEVGHGVSFSIKACGGCHGIEIDQGYGELRLKPFFNVRAGRLNVAFGEFSMRHDPANFSTPSKPLPYAMGDMLQYGLRTAARAGGDHARGAGARSSTPPCARCSSRAPRRPRPCPPRPDGEPPDRTPRAAR
jgi:hypothetical protein